MNQQPLIEMRKVVKVYSSEAGDFTALRGVDLTVQRGEFLGIVGKSGAGKSTLLNMLTGVDDATSGEVIVRAGKEVSVHTLDEDALALWRGETMGVIYQSFQLLPMLSLLENVMLPMDLCGRYHPRKSREKALELLRLVEIEEHAHKLPAFISGGQQQRVAIARALANDPAILVADEPTGSLDSVTADHIFDVFEKLVANGMTIIMVTHDLGLAPRFTRTLVIADGEIQPERPERLLETGKMETLKAIPEALEAVSRTEPEPIQVEQTAVEQTEIRPQKKKKSKKEKKQKAESDPAVLVEKKKDKKGKKKDKKKKDKKEKKEKRS